MDYLCIRLGLPEADLFYNCNLDINYQMLKLQTELDYKIFIFVFMTLYFYSFDYDLSELYVLNIFSMNEYKNIKKIK